MKYLALTFLIIVSIQMPISAKSDKYEEDIIVQEQECLQLFSSNRGFGSSYELRFYNSCPKSVWASICVEERPGRFKLHESASKVPKYGYMNIYTHEGTAPLSVTWRSGAAKPQAPGECGV